MLESTLIRLLIWLGARLPEELSLWCDAILAEASAIEDHIDRLHWLLGGLSVAVKAHTGMRIRGLMSDAEGRWLPAEVVVVAAYQCIFSAVLLGLLLFQLPRITEHWTDALPAVAICTLIALIPGVLGFGLFLLDNAARWGTLVFLIAHALLAWRRISISVVPPTLPVIRIALDAFIIAALLRPAIIRRFIPSRVELKLD
jgi:hypothetical protein